MAFKPNAQASIQNSVTEPKPLAVPPGTSGYSPSVPISVYRELAAELQSTKQLVAAVTAQNQVLVQQNQQLQQEIDRVVQAVLGLRQVSMTVAPVVPPTPSVAPEPDGMDLSASFMGIPVNADYAKAEGLRPTVPTQPQTTAPATPPIAPANLPEAELPDFGKRLFTEQPEEPKLINPKSAKPRDLGGLWLTLTILVIMITAFGAGFLVVRPLLPRGGR